MSSSKKRPQTLASSILEERQSGILLHPSSLPGGHGIGDLGSSARDFVDFLHAAKQRIWQVLPMGPTSKEEFHSPYASLSAFAGNPLLISLDDLVTEGLLKRSDITRALRSNPLAGNSSFVDLKNLPSFKTPLLKLAAGNFTGKAADAKIKGFIKKYPWVSEYARYAALREFFGGPRETWPLEMRIRSKKSDETSNQIISANSIREQIVIQLLFFQQWNDIRAYAGEKGVRMFGDLPIYVSNDSADVWGRPEIFELDKKTGKPKGLSGVPPDVFNSEGQLWGHPLYDWQNLKRDGFRWWIDRFSVARDCFDIVRVDHFRGFESYWAVPNGSKSAKNGRWEACPGEALFDAVNKGLGELPLFVEDLGIITPPVHALRERLGLMGTRVLQFAFGGDVNNTCKSRHHPINTPHQSVLYTATHDNAPIGEWFSELPRANKTKVRGLLNDCSTAEVPEQAVRLAMSLPARVCIVLMQDVLGLSKGNRMNYPGLASWKNWSWRFTNIPKGAEKRLAHLSDIYERNR